MKRNIAILIVFIGLIPSAFAQWGAFLSAQRSSQLPARMLVTFGESNAAGLALNTWLTSTEASTRTQVQILNNTGLVFQDLLIGTNNNIDCNLPDMTTHGIENGLANSVSAGDWPYPSVYLVKTGQAGARIADWISPSTYWTKFKDRIDAAYASQPSLDISIYWSLGLNDLAAGTSVADFKSGTETLITQVRTYLDGKRAGLGSNARIYMTRLMYQASYPNWSAYNTKLDEIAAASSGKAIAMGTSDATLVVGSGGDLHWGYYGNRTLASRFAAGVLGTSYPEKIYTTTNTTWGSPNPISNATQSGVYLAYVSGSPAGAVAASSLNALNGYGVQYYIPTSSDAPDISISFDDDNGNNFAWNGGNTWLLGSFRDSGNLYYGSDGATANSMGSASPYPVWVRLLTYGTDINLAISHDSGNTWQEGGTTSVNPGKGKLSGVSTIYVRGVFASPGAGQKVEVDWLL